MRLRFHTRRARVIAHKSQRLAWRILRWVAAAVIVLLVLAAAGWFTVTREAFLRGPLLGRLLGPRYGEFIQFEHIQAGIFPPSISLFDIQLTDHRAGPGEPPVVARLGKLVLTWRWIPPKTLHVDRVEARGLRLDLSRGANGQWNLARALADLRESRPPQPIRLDAFADADDGGASGRQEREVLLHFWDAGDVRIAWTDRLAGSLIPSRGILEFGDFQILGRDTPIEPIDISAAVNMRIEGYAKILGAPPSERFPLGLDITLSHPLEPRQMGVVIRADVKAPVSQLGALELDAPAALPEDQMIPAWTQAMREAPALASVRGSAAREVRHPLEISNLELRICDPSGGGTLLECIGGRYDFVSNVLQGKVRASGTLKDLLDGLSRSPLPAVGSLGRWIENRGSVRRALANQWAREWTFDANLDATLRHGNGGFWTDAEDAQLDFSASLRCRDPRNLWIDESGAEATTSCLVMNLLSAGTLNLPQMRLELRSLEGSLRRAPVTASSNGPQAGAGEKQEARPEKEARVAQNAKAIAWENKAPVEERVLLSGRLLKTPHSFNLGELASALAAGKLARASAAATAAAEEESRGQAAGTPLWAGDRKLRQRIHQIVEQILTPLQTLGNPPLQLEFVLPSATLREVPAPLRPRLRGVPAEGRIEGKVSLAYIPKTGEIRAEAMLDAEEIRPQGDPPASGFGARLSASGALDSWRASLDSAAATLTTPEPRMYSLEARGGRWNLATGEGECAVEARSLDGGFFALASDLAGERGRAWLEKRRAILQLAELAPGNPEQNGAEASFQLKALRKSSLELDFRGRLDNVRLKPILADSPESARPQAIETDVSAQWRAAGQPLVVRRFAARLIDPREPRPRLEFTTLAPGSLRLTPARIEANASRLLESLERTSASASPADGAAVSAAAASDAPATNTAAALSLYGLAFGQWFAQEDPWLAAPWSLRISKFPFMRLGRLPSAFGLPLQEGRGDVEIAAFPEPIGNDGVPLQTGAGERLQWNWQARGAIRAARLEGISSPAEVQMSAAGRLDPRSLEIERFQAGLPSYAVEGRAHYEFATGNRSLDARASAPSPGALAPLSASDESLLARALAIPPRTMAGALFQAADNAAAPSSIAWHIERQTQQPGILLFTAQRYDSLRMFLHEDPPCSLRVEQQMRFGAGGCMNIEDFHAAFTEDGASSPIVTLRLAEPFEWDSKAGIGEGMAAAAFGLPDTPAAPAARPMAFDLRMNIRALLARLEASRLIPAMNPPLAGIIEARVESCAFPDDGSYGPGWMHRASGWIFPANNGHSGNGGGGEARGEAIPIAGSVSAEADRVRFQAILRAAPWGLPLPCAEAIVTAERSRSAQEEWIEAQVRDAAPALMRRVDNPIRYWFSDDSVRADVFVRRGARRQGQFRDESARIVVRNAALGDPDDDAGDSIAAVQFPTAQTNPGRDVQAARPLHPPLRLSLAYDFSHDLATSTVALRTLHFEASPESDRPATASLALLDLRQPITLNLDTLEVVSAAKEDASASGPMALRVRIGPAELAPYAPALARWCSCPPGLRGEFRLDADLQARPSADSTGQSILAGAMRLANLRVGRPEKPDAATQSAAGAEPEPKWSEAKNAGNNSAKNLALDANVQFRFMLRMGVAAIQHFLFESENAPGAPPDRLNLEGTVFSRRGGLRPDVRVTGDTLNLSKYLGFFSDWVRAREAAEGARRSANQGASLGPRGSALASSGSRGSALASSSARSAASFAARPTPHSRTRDELLRTARYAATALARASRQFRMRMDINKISLGGMAFEKLGLLVRYEGNRLRLSNATTELDKGRLNASGELDFSAPGRIRYEGRCQLEEFPFGNVADRLFPGLESRVQGRVTGEAFLYGQGLAGESLAANLAGQARGTIHGGLIRAGNAAWLADPTDPITASVAARIEGDAVDFSLDSDPEDPRKEIHLRGHALDLFDTCLVRALLRAGQRTQVGPRPPRESGRLDPKPQMLVGGVWRIEGPLSAPARIHRRLESIEY